MAPALPAGIVLFSIFVYRWATEGFAYATHKYPGCKLSGIKAINEKG